MSFWSSTKDVLSGRRPVGSVIGTAVKGYRTVRVAVMGSKASGKTVFLTALANHLQDHRPTEFPLGGRIVTWDKDAISGDTLHGLPRFSYEAARAFLAKGEWPAKTTATSILALRLLVEDKKGRQENVQLEVADIPGERIADFAMKGRSYRAWCRWMQRESATPASPWKIVDIAGEMGEATQGAVEWAGANELISATCKPLAGLVGKVAEGGANAFLVYRLGCRAMDAFRPLRSRRDRP